MADGPYNLITSTIPQLMGYLSFTKAELIALLRHFPTDTVVGITADLADEDATTERYVPLSPMTVAALLVSLDQLQLRYVSVAEEERCFFVIHLKAPDIDVNRCVIVADRSPLFAQLRAKQKSLTEPW